MAKRGPQRAIKGDLAVVAMKQPKAYPIHYRLTETESALIVRAAQGGPLARFVQEAVIAFVLQPEPAIQKPERPKRMRSRLRQKMERLSARLKKVDREPKVTRVKTAWFTAKEHALVLATANHLQMRPAPMLQLVSIQAAKQRIREEELPKSLRKRANTKDVCPRAQSSAESGC